MFSKNVGPATQMMGLGDRSYKQGYPCSYGTTIKGEASTYRGDFCSSFSDISLKNVQHLNLSSKSKSK